uniref:Uncharacterized protein n=1 Tax=viral metagenome TaxID=1070528 RepID=A0A6M3J798_9ZZZZ
MGLAVCHRHDFVGDRCHWCTIEELDARAAKAAVFQAALREISRWRESCHEYDEDMGHDPRSFDEETVATIERFAAEELKR